MTLNQASIVMALLVGATACGSAPGDDLGEVGEGEDGGDETTLICAASEGGPGGDAGSVFVQIKGDVQAAFELDRRLDDFVDAGPGAGGLGGEGTLAPDKGDGAAGGHDHGVVVMGNAEWTFDGSEIDPDWIIDVSTDGGVVRLPHLSDPPDVVASELRVRVGATLVITCDARITAERIIVEQGATLGFRNDNRSGCVWSFGGYTPDPGARGGVAWLETRSLELHGTLDLAGTEGAPGAPGGAGGALTLRAETITLGDDAAIVVAGGAGGDGNAEMPCP